MRSISFESVTLNHLELKIDLSNETALNDRFLQSALLENFEISEFLKPLGKSLEENFGAAIPFDKDNAPEDFMKILDGAFFSMEFSNFEENHILNFMNAVMGAEQWTLYNCLEVVHVTFYSKK